MVDFAKKQMGIEPYQKRYEDSMPSVPFSWVKNQDSPTEFVYSVISSDSGIPAMPQTPASALRLFPLISLKSTVGVTWQMN
jgi:hypothetical protein